MKFLNLVALLLLLGGCSLLSNSKDEPVLKDKLGWQIDSLSAGAIHYSFSGEYVPFASMQCVNVIEFDLSVEGNSMELKFLNPGDSLSAVAERMGAFAGINGTYEPMGSYMKIGGEFYMENDLAEDDLMFWKHEGALFFDNECKHVNIRYANDKEYRDSRTENIISGSPMLIDNYRPVGKEFVGDVDGLDLDSLEYEDYRRHQGVRHPRSAVALTDDGKLLLIAVDGRQSSFAAGMTARELTEFIHHYFAPKSALNIDGGGSTTLWMCGFDDSSEGVVNYPSDNRTFDHYGQRKVMTFILLDQE